MDNTQIYQVFLSDKSTPDNAPVNMTGVPSDYHDFTNVFSKTHACTPTPHWPYDLKIKLEEGTSCKISYILLLVDIYAQHNIFVLYNT